MDSLLNVMVATLPNDATTVEKFVIVACTGQLTYWYRFINKGLIGRLLSCLSVGLQQRPNGPYALCSLDV